MHAGLQMSQRIEALAKDAPEGSNWGRLAEEAGLTWAEARGMTFAEFCARLADVRRGLVRP